MAMTFTLNQMVMLGLFLLIGFFIGLMISGRSKYKRLWREEQVLHKQARHDRDTQVDAANARVTALESQQRRTLDTSSPVQSNDASDDLTAIRTISAQDQVVLNEAGYHRYAQIAAMDAREQADVEARMGRMPGLIARDEWPQQAQLLEQGKRDDHLRLYERRKTPV